MNPRTAPQLAARAERLHAELVAAGPYAPVPPTWATVASQLGVKPKTLEKARQRARQYAARGTS